MNRQELPRIKWPEGKRFAFTVFDDTDLATLENVRPVYDFLAELGLRTTKSVWPLSGDLQKAAFPGETCDDADYCRWVQQLQEQGFEIALHNVTYHTSDRETTRRGLERFRELFGHDPKTCANHSRNAEALYWAEQRLSGIHVPLYGLLSLFRRWGRFHGHRPGHPLFWGDLCRRHIKYFRNFCYADVNTLRACPWMPYHDPKRPYVNYWFAATEGGRVESFVSALSERNQEQLEEQNGACIIYTHFALGFWQDGRLEPRFRRLMERLAQRPGWFVPVGTLLDYILEQRGHHELTDRQRSILERRWLWDKLRLGFT